MPFQIAPKNRFVNSTAKPDLDTVTHALQGSRRTIKIGDIVVFEMPEFGIGQFSLGFAWRHEGVQLFVAHGGEMFWRWRVRLLQELES